MLHRNTHLQLDLLVPQRRPRHAGGALHVLDVVQGRPVAVEVVEAKVQRLVCLRVEVAHVCPVRLYDGAVLHVALDGSLVEGQVVPDLRVLA